MRDRSDEPPFNPDYDPRSRPRGQQDPRDPRYDPRYDSRDPRYDDRLDPRDDPYYDRRDEPRASQRGRAVPPPVAPPPVTPRRSRGRTLALIAGLIGLLLVALFAYRMTRSGPGEDRLDEGTASTNVASASTGEERCGSQRTYDLVKQQLFRQAAQVRGSDQTAFDRLAAYATVRVTAPVLKREDEELGTLVCSGNVALDVPPGVGVVGGRRTLQANLDYSLQRAADGSGDVVTLSGADAIVVPLATLARTGSQPGVPQPQAQAQGQPQTQPQPEPVAPGTMVPVAPRPTNPPPLRAAPPVNRSPERTPPPPVARTPRVSANPSFNCARARTPGEVAVCRSPQLASLDREMAGFFNSAVRNGDPETRAILQRTRTRFLSFRDRCGSDRCIADAYRGRITEIRDIVDGRWRGQ